jgi:uncharacterized protein (DUF1499 family)
MMKKLVRVLSLFLLFIMGCSGRQVPVGHTNGKFTLCPSSPNCVSSQSIEAGSRIDPLVFSGDGAGAEEKLVAVLNAMKRVRIVAMTDGYIHAEFSSALFRFVDDVEFYINTQESIIHFRSASRVGYSDFGVNRKRMEEIRRLFKKEENGS